MLATKSNQREAELLLIIDEQSQQIKAQQEIIHQQQEEIERLRKLVEKLQHQLSVLTRHQFGKRSEKDDVPDGDVEDGDPAPPEELEFVSVKAHERKKRGRKVLPDDLVRIPVYYDIPEQAKQCPCQCGRILRFMRNEITEEIVIIPETIYVRQHIRPVYGGCLHDDKIIVTPMLAPVVKKGLAAPETIAYVATNKYADSLPLYRQEKRLARQNINISRQTLYDWLYWGYNVLKPLINLVKTRVFSCSIVHTDDTPIKVQEPGLKKTREGRLWVYVGRNDKDQITYVYYEYSPSRKKQYPIDCFGNYSGYIQADAYPGYDSLFIAPKMSPHEVGPPKKVSTEVGCCMHARRYFFDVANKNKKKGIAYEAVQIIKRLYQIETEARPMTAEERYALRQEKSVPILQNFKEWLDEKQQTVMPKTPLADAITYAKNNWEALCRYTEDGRLEIDNGLAERLIKTPCIGKKNYLFFGSDEGGRVAAGYYTLIQSCEAYHINSYEYITDLLRRLPGKLYYRIEDLLPENWKPFNPFPESTQHPETPLNVVELIKLFSQPP